MACSNYQLNYQNCACYTMLFTKTIENGEKRSSCDCYVSCYTCDQLVYAYNPPSNSSTSAESQTCICNQQCYQEATTCSCNASCFLQERECTCYEQRYGCGINEGCTCNESCDGYIACQCDQTGFENLCRQCHLTTYDTNSPSYHCLCDFSCDNYTLPACNCDGRFQVSDEDICLINTIQQECEQGYSNNICDSYISNRYY